MLVQFDDDTGRLEDIYGAPLEKLTPPIGYRFTGEFRILRNGDSWMSPTGHACLGAYDDTEIVRLILEKLPPNPTIKDVYGTDNPAIPKGWRFKEFRQVDRREKIYILGNRCHSALEVSKLGFAQYNWRIVLEKEVDLSTLTYTETLTVKDVYGDIPQVPSGYKVIGFRRPKTGNTLLNGWGEIETADCDWDGRYSPRLILSPLGPR